MTDCFTQPDRNEDKMNNKINTLSLDPYGTEPYVLVYKTPEMAYPETKKFGVLKHAMWYVADLENATGIKIRILF